MTSRQRLANARINAVSIVKAKLSGAERFASRPTLQGRVHFNIRGRATFGAQFIAEGHIIPVSIFVAQGATLTVGNHVYLNAGATIEVWHEVRIGSNVQLAPNASVIDDDRHKVEPDAVLYKGPTVIGDNVWLGRNAAVLPGATIGDGSVIGANSVVTKDVPPGVFAAGAPARVIRKLDLPDGWYRS